MNQTTTNYTILCIDDEDNILRALQRLFLEEEWRLLFANSSEKGLEMLQSENVHLILCDHRMPKMTGIEFLNKAKEIRPDAIRLILSGYADVNAIAAAINEGEVYRYIAKPWNDEELKTTIRQSLERYELMIMNRQLLDQVTRQNHELKKLNMELEKTVEKRTEELCMSSHVLQLSQDILENFPIAVAGVSDDGSVVLSNGKAEATLGKMTGTLLAHNVRDIFPQSLVDNMVRTLECGAQWKEENVSVNGERFRIECYPVKAGRKGAMVLWYPTQSTG